ncbi:hypothetical protein BE28_0051 [Staphylococcus phage vB_SepS_BE28]|nr:hypothetical protein BE28_0051 [Staphylococcus phage vB_SepS_BE28]DAI80441.1 MAG TPA: hypothetical protein [Caudoviricetes sp.]DAI84623.1 MAG TPA: hypothetical protein [Caudoviricetes sp.]DAU94770.1 MAG TPA: hypothetical protein [Caudoviricetes sp.]
MGNQQASLYGNSRGSFNDYVLSIDRQCIKYSCVIQCI